MKKPFLSVLTLMIIVLAACAVSIPVPVATAMPSASPSSSLSDKLYGDNVNTFDMADYKFYIESFSNEKRSLGNIIDAGKLAEKVNDLWVEIYGENIISRERPYHIFRDEQNHSWMVQGDGAFINGGVGGVAVIIVSDSGEVLALYHGK